MRWRQIGAPWGVPFHWCIRTAFLLACCGLLVELPGAWSQQPAAPQEPATTEAQTTAGAPQPSSTAPSPTVEEAISRADNAWMLTSSALVLLMTAPGLAMFYGGLVRKKNVLSVMMQCVFLMGMLSVVWALWGYSLAFGGNGSERPWIGSPEFLFMQNVERTWNADANSVETPMEGTIPRLTHMLFQGMFFIITPALICGAFAERMRFPAMALFMLLWGTVVYCPLAHWVWDGGILAYGSPVAWAGGALDFAGGTVVHISSGVSALVCALLIGKRLGFGTEQMPPHNLTYTILGAAMLWIGWFGFNAGSALNATGLAAAAFAATHLAAAAGGLGWASMEWCLRGRPTVLGFSSGVVAGLVCITPASGYVTPMPAVLMGVAAGVVCYLACTSLKNHFKYDDSLDAFGVHGVGGTLGALLTGVFATRATTDPVVSGGKALGLIDGSIHLLIGQIVAVVVTWILASVGTFILLKIVDALVGLRVTPESEIQGLDLSEHGEEGYIFL